MADDRFEDAAQPHRPLCGKVMRGEDGGYVCAWGGTRIDVPCAKRPDAVDDLPGIHSG